MASTDIQAAIVGYTTTKYAPREQLPSQPPLFGGAPSFKAVGELFGRLCTTTRSADARPLVDAPVRQVSKRETKEPRSSAVSTLLSQGASGGLPVIEDDDGDDAEGDGEGDEGAEDDNTGDEEDGEGDT
jgi:hypothetical protein